MRRFLVPVAGVALIIGAASFALAEEATPSATPTACASPVAVASPIASPVASPPAGCGAAVSVEVGAVDIAFQPKELTIPANTPVELVVVNKGLALHNFGIDVLKINLDLVPGEKHTITINVAAGDYAYYCDIPGHAAAGMFGTLHAK